MGDREKERDGDREREKKRDPSTSPLFVKLPISIVVPCGAEAQTW